MTNHHCLAVMQLVRPVKSSWMPQCSATCPGSACGPRCLGSNDVRHLLNQTSGLRLLPSEVAMADSMIARMHERQVRPIHAQAHRPVGAKFEYSNTNTTYWADRRGASGESYSDLSSSNLQPLEMRHSYTSKAPPTRWIGRGHQHWFSLPSSAGHARPGRLFHPASLSPAQKTCTLPDRPSQRGTLWDVQILSAPASTNAPRASEVIMWASRGILRMGGSISTGKTKTFSTAETFLIFLPLWGSFQSRREAWSCLPTPTIWLPSSWRRLGMRYGPARRPAARSDQTGLYPVDHALLPRSRCSRLGVFATLKLLRQWERTRRSAQAVEAPGTATPAPVDPEPVAGSHPGYIYAPMA